MKSGYLIGETGEIFAEITMFSNGSTAIKFDGQEKGMIHGQKQAEIFFLLCGTTGSTIDWRSGCSPQK